MKLIALAVSIVFAVSAFAGEKSIKEILDYQDKLYRSDTCFAKMEMKIVTPHWERTMKMDSWSYKLEKTFIRILSPRKDKGISTLRIDNDMWNYFPKVDKVMKVPPSMRMGSWMGSDFTNDDLVKESSMAEDYNSKFGQNTKEHYMIELSPKPNAISLWERITLKIDKKTLLPIEQKYYDERKELVRTMYFKEVKSLGGKTIPTVMELVSNKKEGNRTIVRYLVAEFDKKINNSVFTRKNLQKRR